MAKKKVKIKLTKEEYKVLKKNAKYNYVTPKKYLKILASADFCNGSEIKVLKQGSPVKVNCAKDLSDMSIKVVDQGLLFRSFIGNAIATKRAEKYRERAKKKDTSISTTRKIKTANTSKAVKKGDNKNGKGEKANT